MTTESKLIRGKVARILNARELILNIGLEHGVRTEMLFDVLDKASEDIQDPDTGEILGTVNRPKVRVKIAHVQQKMSVATTYRSRDVNVGGSGPSLDDWSSLFIPPRWVRQYETLKTDETTWENLKEEDSYVATGDPVVEVIDDSDEN